MLLLHGAFSGAWCWAESWLQTFALAGRYAAAVSLRGHGGSEGWSAVWSARLADFIEDVRFAIAAMPEPPVVVAHSIGGLIAQRLLGSVRMRGLILAGSLPPEGLAVLGPLLGLSGAATGWASAFSPLGRSGPFLAPDDPRALFGRHVGRTAAERYLARMGEGALAAIAEAHLPLAVAPAFAVGVPALVMTGVEDRLVDPATAMRSALYHYADYRACDGAGHFLMLGARAADAARSALDWMETRNL